MLTSSAGPSSIFTLRLSTGSLESRAFPLALFSRSLLSRFFNLQTKILIFILAKENKNVEANFNQHQPESSVIRPPQPRLHCRAPRKEKLSCRGRRRCGSRRRGGGRGNGKRNKKRWSQFDDATNDLRQIRCFLKEAEKRAREGDAVFQDHVSEVREAAYDLEDVIATFILKEVIRRSKVTTTSVLGSFSVPRLTNKIHGRIDLHKASSEMEKISAKISKSRLRFQG